MAIENDYVLDLIAERYERAATTSRGAQAPPSPGHADRSGAPVPGTRPLWCPPK
jgi:hypothetical protein